MALLYRGSALRQGFFLLSKSRPKAWDQTEKIFKEVNTLPKGTVKWFNEKKGYGFIKQDDGQDIFVHFSSITMSGFKTLTEGDEVTYDIEDGNRGPVAKNVARAQGTSGSADVSEAPVDEETAEAEEAEAAEEAEEVEEAAETEEAEEAEKTEEAEEVAEAEEAEEAPEK